MVDYLSLTMKHQEKKAHRCWMLLEVNVDARVCNKDRLACLKQFWFFPLKTRRLFKLIIIIIIFPMDSPAMIIGYLETCFFLSIGYLSVSMTTRRLGNSDLVKGLALVTHSGNVFAYNGKAGWHGLIGGVGDSVCGLYLPNVPLYSNQRWLGRSTGLQEKLHGWA